MSRINIAERILRRQQVMAWLQLMLACTMDSPMWYIAQMGYIYSMGTLEIDDIPTAVARRDVDSFLSPQDCINFLRFSQAQIITLQEALGVPEYIRTSCSYVVSGREALCVLLYWLAYPCRLKDMRLLFGLSDSCTCEAFNFMLHFMDLNWGLLLNLHIAAIVLRLPEFAQAIHATGALLSTCWGFIDGTVRGVARPIRGQRALYNGHKRKHGLKYQGVITPDGMFADLWGPIAGSGHDAYMLDESNLLNTLATHMNGEDGTPYCLYGDPAYGQHALLCSPFEGSVNGELTEPMKIFNKSMSQCRVTVEWGSKEMTANGHLLI